MNLLTQDELAEASDCKRTQDQIRWLRAHGVPFVLSAKGRPKVLREELERLLRRDENSGHAQGPDFSHIRKAS